jgi:hydrogenase nickel incorporation protein HypB
MAGHGHEQDHVHTHTHDHSQQHGQGHAHRHERGHEHGHDEEHGPRLLRLEQEVLGRNNEQAGRNRRWLDQQGILAVNLMSAPGAGKTALLERTTREVGAELRLQVIEGDQETDRDARRLRAAGCPAVQINTGAGCHLDATMVERGLAQLHPPSGSVVVIENVGNLVCPALFDLGERARVVLSAVTEGDDKPVKYPHMFRSASLVLLNKVDLLPHVPFDVDRFLEHTRLVNPGVRVLPLSVTRGDGMPEWEGWMREQARHAP